MLCPYCGKEAPWVENKAKYGRNYGRSFMCYYCRECDAYVGCHNNTRNPLGTMANAELRSWRQRAHRVFDPLWQGQGGMSRKQAYRWLSGNLGYEAHIAEADVETCKKIIGMCTNQIIL